MNPSSFANSFSVANMGGWNWRERPAEAGGSPADPTGSASKRTKALRVGDKEFDQISNSGWEKSC